jgi:hypothetical protein
MCGINLRGKFSAFLLISTLLMFTWSVPLAFINVKPVEGILVAEQHYINVPFYYQVKTYYCGPAALQMVFDFYGENVSQFEIADVARTVPYVTYTDELRRAAHFSDLSTSMGSEMPENITGYTTRKLGYAAFEMGGMTLDDLKSLIDQDYPIILLMRWVPGETYGHYRVAVGYNETHVFLHDPWNNIEWGGDYGGPNLAMNYTFFADMWTYMGNWSLFVSPWKADIKVPDIVYVGKPFTVDASISYVRPRPFSAYDYTASPCKASIILPDGLILVEGEEGVDLGDFAAASIANVSWTVKATRSENFSIWVEAKGIIRGSVGEKPDGGPSYNYTDIIGGYASCSVSALPPSQIYISEIDPPQGPPGTKVRVAGGGATPNGPVEALFSGPVNQTIVIISSANNSGPIVVNETIVINMTVGRTIASEAGFWEIIFYVPDVSPGNYTVYAVDKETLTSDAIGFGVLPAQVGIKIRYVSPTSGPPGTLVSISGDYATINGEVKIFFDNISAANTTANDWGGWSTSFRVPKVEPGDYTIKVLDVISNTTDTAMFTVTLPPTIYVSPPEAPIGSKITISGEGFPSRTGIYLTFEDLLFFTPIYIDENGKFNTTIFVPVVNSGNYTIKAVGPYFYPEGVKMLANASFRVTVGLDTLFQNMNDTQNALDTLTQMLSDAQNILNQTQSTAQTTYNEASSANEAANAAKDEALSAEEAAQSAEAVAAEARTYALSAMIFAILTTIISGITLIKKRR